MKTEKTCAIADIEVYSTESIYTRIICLMITSSIKIEDVLKYKMSPVSSLMKMEISD